ncbi:branched-chain amino acid ABC transporter permease [Conexibacter sp. CPCC 206217]|uniref:branched-chain amino acid ABC transporter permease n=1 Tax=Conexibacter sp. CPCC 206217 TaxID=3064574 RepID=UPI00271DD433|nr:branched-chain amino acid ABC transporter permease [Conexibacter sp. CPCC 206217]MDO8211099.1 branched-chain amino acid ABC transporter permease [Conexibacter sp. CPCC 206217]
MASRPATPLQQLGDLGGRWRQRRLTATGTHTELPLIGAPRAALLAIALALVAIAYVSGAGTYAQSVIALGCGYLIAALGYNLTLGYAGQFAFGQAGFLAIGAYVYAVLQEHGTSWLPALVAAALAAAFAGAVIGLAVLRTSGFYLALITLSFAQAVVVAIDLLRSLTHADDGISVSFFDLDTVYPAIVLAALALLLVDRLIHSRSGRAFLMIGSDESAARAVGVPIGLARVAVFSLGGLLGGIGGVVIAGALGFVTPENFSVQLTLLLLTMIVVGGLGSLIGTVVGVAVFTALPELSASFVGWQDVAYGVILLAVIFVLPGGLISLPATLRGLRERVAGRGSARG